MAILAIKGHSTRGKEVIELLEMLGGKNVANYDGSNTRSFYFLNNIIICSSYGSGKLLGIDCYTLEEFLENFPYMVGDKVTVKELDKVVTITDMSWRNGKEIIYETIHKEDCYECFSAEELQPYKEETMEIPEKLMPKIDFNKYCKDKYILDLGNYEIKEENGKTYAVRKLLEYPKTYDECCKIMGIEYPVVGGKPDGLSASTYRIDEIRPFIYLLICRDAYWKIAGEQMGLGKPWEPDWRNINEDKYCIEYSYGSINSVMTNIYNYILAFPIAEMRNTFYENFKELIEQCKELL